MTRTEELLKLCEDDIIEDVLGVAELKQLIALVRLQHDALKWAAEVDSAYDGEPADELTEAIAAFNKFERGE